MELTRKQIYDMMWTDGVGKTEINLGLKQAELKVLCDKYDIPRPSSGYWSARLEEEERKRLLALKKAELGKVQELLFEADRWRISRIIREYIIAFKAHLERLGLSEDEKMIDEITWMESKADFIDPFIDDVEELLDEDDLEKVINPQIIKTEESKPSYGYYDSGPQYSYWQLMNMWHK